MIQKLLGDGRYDGVLYFILGSLVSFVISYVFYKRSIRGRNLVYESCNDTIIDKNNKTIPLEIDILYKQNSVEKLVRTYVYMWNNGAKTIRNSDLVGNDELRIEFDGNLELDGGMEIYSCKTLNNTDKSNNFLLNIDKEMLTMSFDYLEPGNGVKIEILHNCDTAIATVKGKVIDVRGGIKNSKHLINSKVNRLLDLANFIGVYVISFTGGLLTAIIFALISKITPKLEWMVIVGLFACPLVAAIASPMLLKRYQRSQTYPSKLDEC